MNTDIRLSVNFFTSLKVRKLIKRLGADGVMSLQKLWIWCALERPAGVLTKCTDEDIELASEWEGEAGEFVAALCELGFLDLDEETHVYEVHDWIENNPYAADSISRSESGRLSRLKRENAVAAKKFIAEGRKGITKEEYAQAKLEGKNKDTLQGAYGEPTTEPSTPKPKPKPKPEPKPKPKPEKAEEAGGGEHGKQELLLTDFTPEESEIVRLFSGVNGLKFDAQKLVRQTRDLRGEYPNVNILSEVKKMALWLDCADGKKKSGKRNLLLFVRNWIERANNTPSPPLRELERKRNGSMSLRNADGTFGELTPEEEAEQRALEERYSNLDEEGNRIT